MAEPSCLASDATRRLLRRYVSPRVAPCDVDDVIQATLLDAVASARAPERGEELQRWLLAIARYKVVDVHRARRRLGDADPADQSAPAPAFEVLAIAEWAARQLPDRGDARTLGWMVREADGDKLESIAVEEGVPAARVRKRVSRLRRWMRERWRAELGVLVIALLGAGAVERTLDHRRASATITAEGASDARLRGMWRLEAFAPDTDLSAARRALYEASERSLTVGFDGSHVVLATPAAERRFTVVRYAGGELELRDESGKRLDVALTWDGDVLVAKLRTGPWAGSARLVRLVR